MGKKVTFSKAELERYSRHIILPEFGIEGQEKLSKAKVLVIGAGGLGSPLLLYLAAAGIGHIGIVDFDVVAESNLQRQILYCLKDVGKSKVEIAKNRLIALNQHIEIQTYNTELDAANALQIMSDYDVVADGTDNFPTRYLVNDACVLLKKPNVYASIFRFEGQVSVFNYAFPDGSKGPQYRDLFPSPPPPGLVPSCAEGGVLGVLPGIIGSIQCNEVIKVISGMGDPLAGRLFLFDALSFTTRILRINKNPDTPVVDKLIDYDAFCGMHSTPPNQTESDIPEISVQELKRWKDEHVLFQLIDIREPQEYDIANLGAELIPPAALEENIHKIATDRKVVFHCRSGKRSADAIRLLQNKYKYHHIYNLKGGILAYADEIDTSLAKY
jgi:adenylyltransferase/sulfurtransferase